jgi:hypothetical protein
VKSLKNFMKRNAPVFFLGLIIALVFLVIILAQPNSDNNVPAGFKKVEEGVFKEGEPTEPTKEETPPSVYAPQVPSPENKGKPYFYGENDPNLRDKDGYPASPPLGSTVIPESYSQEDRDVLKGLEMEKIAERSKPTRISFTSDGFSPADTSGFTGREIIWTNNTANEIKIIEAVPRNEALKNGAIIKPGGSFSFKPLVDRMFTYMEVNSKKYGTVMVNDITVPLLDGYSPGM